MAEEKTIRKKFMAEDMETVVLLRCSGQGGATSWDALEGKPFETIDVNAFSTTEGNLSVKTINDAIQDNTLPITSAGVYTIVGNIQALLSLI